MGWRIVTHVVIPGFRDGSQRAAFAVALSAPLGLLFLGFPVSVALKSLADLVCFRRFSGDRGFLRVEPKPLPPADKLPTVVIMVPVHLEPLRAVIAPTIRSACAAARRYRGPATVVVCDDAIALLREAGHHQEVDERLDLYRRLGVAVVARPAWGRSGRFAKASNLNTAMAAADLLAAYMAEASLDHASAGARTEAVAALAAAGRFGEVLVRGDIGLGELILLLDKDSWVPADVLNEVVGELVADHGVVIAQLAVTALNPHDTPTAKWVAGGTEILFELIIPSVARAGGPAPFVGHNALLRTEALRRAARPAADGANSGLGGFTYWDEVVSEDLSLSLRLQSAGGQVVYIWYPGLRTKEGVALDYRTELAKLAKFAVGAAEIVVSPITGWRRGPRLNPVFVRYLASARVPWYAKVDLVFYLATFAAIASAPLVLPMVLVGEWGLGGRWGQVWVSGLWVMALCLAVFMVLGTFAGAVHQRRLAKADLASPLGRTTRDHLAAVVPTFIFWTSIAFVMAGALLGYLAGGRRRFGPTPMDPLDPRSRRGALRRLWRTHRGQFVFALLTLAVIAFTVAVPAARIHGAEHVLVAPAVSALCHLAAPAVFESRWRGRRPAAVSPLGVPLDVGAGVATDTGPGAAA